MVLLFNYRIPRMILLQPLLEMLLLFAVFLICTLPHRFGGEAHAVGVVTAGSMFALVAVASLAAFGLYRYALRGSTLSRWLRGAFALAVGFALARVAFLNLGGLDVYVSSLPTVGAAAVASVAMLRLAIASGKRLDWFSHRILVLGTGVDAVAVERSLSSMTASGVSFVGFYPSGASGEIAVPKEAVLSSSTPLEVLVGELRVHEVIVALREQRGGTLPLSELLACRLRGVRVTDLSGFFERMTGEVPIDALKASWLIYGEGFRQGWARRLVKRGFDICAATLLLAIGLPVMLLTAIAIWLDSPGPILFFQERVGLGGRVLRVIKFRSMRIDAEKDGTPRWARSGDSRVTRVGRLIRKARIDELPQIFNVLRGEMSLVGPRPERPYFVSKLTDHIPFYGARHTLKPGLTGWAQVRCDYGASIEDSAKKLQYDLYYVKNHTLFLDLLILLKTIKVVASGKGAH